MSDGKGPLTGVYTIAAGQPFVDTLAAGVMECYGATPQSLAAVSIFLPTRRACRTLGEAFLRQSEGRALLLPRMMPLGDVEDDEALIFAGETATAHPPAISPLMRRLTLARIIGETAARDDGDQDLTADHAVKLAGALIHLLDQVQTEGLTFEALVDLVPEEYAHHWQITLEFLEIIAARWPKSLTGLAMIDPVERHNLAVADQLAAWRARPPAAPVIAAGSTGSLPTTAALIAQIAALPQGCVVLPGLDRHLDAESWEAIGPTHPQFGMRQLCAHLDCARQDVVDFPVSPKFGARLASPKLPVAQRARFLADALRPAETSDRWARLEPVDEAALEGLTRIDCTDTQAEAATISLIMRQCLEQKDGVPMPPRCALITPDRGLARRVAAELGRWNIVIDDSAGTNLAETTVGTFLKLAIDMVAERAAPVPLLALFKHPLSAGGWPPARFRAVTRQLELAVLRGPRPAAGLKGLHRRLAAMTKAAGPDAEPDAEPDGRNALDMLTAWIAAIEQIAQPLIDAMAGPPISLAKLLRVHVAFAEALAATDDHTPLWSGDAGEAAAVFIAELIDAAADYPTVIPAQYPALLRTLMADKMVRPRYGGHPRLAILGPLEARLQHHDIVILGGLNEASWPPEARVDPWMGRHMRAAFGLPQPERRIGLAAHDFLQASCAPRVYWTRAERVEGSPTVPSRWITRAQTLDRRTGPDLTAWSDWARAIDRTVLLADNPHARRPAPRPPVAARPRALSVTEIERWMRDPYAIYARHVLDLRALNPIDDNPDQAGYGTLIHRALDRFIADCPTGALPDDAEARLIARGAELLDTTAAHPSIRAFWWPRFLRIAQWFVAHETAYRADGGANLARAHSELAGRLEIAAPAGPFTLTARADRIDIMGDGGISITDYKTGAIPGDKEVEAGFAPQLPLEAAIAQAGGFAGHAGRRARRIRLRYLAPERRRSGRSRSSRSNPWRSGRRQSLAVAARDGLERAGCANSTTPRRPICALPAAGLGA